MAVEACVDSATHVIAAEGWPPPRTGRAAFETLATHGRLERALAERLGRAVGLRNLLVHQYSDVDVAVIAHVVATDLGDLRAFAAVAAGWLGASD